MATLTGKGEETRQRILEVALERFASDGYDKTTMRSIAAAADCSLGLAYRYFSSKEEMVMLLYLRTAEQFAERVMEFGPAPLSAQIERAMLTKLSILEPHKEVLSALFGAAMNPKSRVAVLGDTTADIRQTTRDIYATLLRNTTDTPPAHLVDDMATVLYGAHLAMILFWFYDRTPEYKATRDLISIACDVLSLMRPLLWLPPVAKFLQRFAHAIGPMFIASVDETKGES